MIASYSRVKKVREAMQRAGIDIYLMENTDPHQSEYLPDHWKEVEWLSGFRGEVAILAITQSEALLWTDSRFFISGAEQLRPRWKRVINTVDGAMGEAMGKLYVERFFPAAAKHRMVEMVNNLKEAFAQRIDQATWMDPETKSKGKEKLTKDF